MKLSRQLATILSAMAFNMAFLTNPALAGTLTWSGGGSDGSWSKGDNWAGTAPINSDNLIFNGLNNTANNNDISGLTLGFMQFNNGGFVLSGKSLTLNPSTAGIFTNLVGVNVIGMDLNISSQNKTINIAAGSELQISGAVTNSQTANPLATFIGGGTLRIISTNFQPQRFFTINNGSIIFDGAYATALDGYRLNPASAGQTAATYITNNSVLRLGSGGNLRLGQNAVTGGSTVQVHISSGKLELAPSATGAGNINLGEQSGVTATFTQDGGLVWGNPAGVISDAGSCKLIFGLSSASASGTYNLNGGTLAVRQISQTQAAATGVFNFNGGKLMPVTNHTTFFQGVQTANVQDGGAVIDTTNFNITIGQNLLAAGTGVGGLTKMGNGTLTLTGNNTYAGPTVINGGALVTSTASTGAGAYTVADNAKLEVQVTGTGKSLSMSSLTLGTSGNITNNFTLGANASTTVPAVVITGDLNLNGAVNVSVTGTGLTAPNSYVLMSYGSLSGSGSFVSGTLPAITGYVASLTNDTTARTLLLVYTPAPEAVKWAVANGDWNTTSPNWTPVVGSGLVNYAEGSPVLLDDTATGTSPITLYLTGNRTPSSLTNDSTKDYVLTGANILGTPLTKNGNGTLVLANGSANTFASVAINAGTIQIGNNDTSGSLGSSAIANNGTLAFNRADNLSVANVISGTGGVSQNGTNTLTLSAANTYSGPTKVNAGTLNLGNSAALGPASSSVTVQSGATFNISGINLGTKPIVVGGPGANGSGALINMGPDQNDASVNVQLTGDTVVGGSALFGIRTGADTDPGLVANGFKLTKIGAGQFNLNGGKVVQGLTKVWGTDLGDVEIQQGTLSFQRRMSLGSPTGTITIYPAASMLLFSLNQTLPVPSKNINMTNATIEGSGGASSDGNTLAGIITVNGSTNNIRASSGTIFTIQSAVEGSGSIQYSGSVNLSGNNTYSGSTYVSSGTLTLASGGSLSGTTNITVASGATFDVSAVAPWTLGVNQAIEGTGTVKGNLVANGLVTSGTASNKLTFNNDLTLAGVTSFQITKDGVLTNDSLVVNGALSFGGELKVVLNGATPLAVGDVFKLFSFGIAPTGIFASTNLPSEYYWDLTQLAVDGTIRVAAPPVVEPPAITQTTFENGNLIFSGTNGVRNGTYWVLYTTNIAEPLANWTSLSTNTCDANGNFSCTNSISPEDQQRFFKIMIP